jgi:mannose/cellobiose epimerase-like protein (N-acyl-D-glucosamine 2-epimerase family)
MMEALTSYCRLTSDARARERLAELVIIMSQTTCAENLAGSTEFFDRGWRLPSDFKRVVASFGHAAENVTLLIDALDALGLSQSLCSAYFRRTISEVLSIGFDHAKGGFYHSAPVEGDAPRLVKYAWVQAEGLVSMLTMYRLFGDEAYAMSFEMTLDWIVSHQIDWENGGWYCATDPDGGVRANEIQSWNSPYHQGRAVLRSLDLLQGLTGRG